MKKVRLTGLAIMIAGFFLAVGCSQNTGKNVGGCENGTYSKSKLQDSTILKNGI